MLLKLKVLMTGLEESLKVLFEPTTEGSVRISKQFESEVAQGLENIYADFTYSADKIFDGLKTFLLKSTTGALREIAKCVAMLSNRLVSVREASSDKPSGSFSGTSAAAADAEPSTSAGASSKAGPQ